MNRKPAPPWAVEAPTTTRDPEANRRYQRAQRLTAFEADLERWRTPEFQARYADQIAYRQACLERWADYLDGWTPPKPPNRGGRPTGPRRPPKPPVEEAPTPPAPRRGGGAQPGAGGTARPLGISLEHGQKLREMLKASTGGYSGDRAFAWGRQRLERDIDATYEAFQKAKHGVVDQLWDGEIL